MPILLKLPDALNTMLNPQQWSAVIVESGIVEVLDLIGNKCIEIIAHAFDTGGFGNWIRWHYSYAKLRERLMRNMPKRRKKFIGPVNPGLLLVRTGQMANSITYAVVRKGAPSTPIAPII
jgi:hypothetical protein